MEYKDNNSNYSPDLPCTFCKCIKGIFSLIFLPSRKYRLANGFFIVGEAYYDKGNFDQAYDFYKIAVKLMPNSGIFLNRLGLLTHEIGNIDEAIKLLDKTLKIDLEANEPEYIARDENNLGRALLEKGEYSKAMILFENSLKRFKALDGEYNTDIAMVQNSLGNALSEIDEYDKAITYYKSALEINIKAYNFDDPIIAINRNDLGKAWLDKGEYGKAIICFEQALKSLPKDDKLTVILKGNLGDALFEIGKYEEAESYYKEALQVAKKYNTEEKDNNDIIILQERLDEVLQAKNEKGDLFIVPSKLDSYSQGYSEINLLKQ